MSTTAIPFHVPETGATSWLEAVRLRVSAHMLRRLLARMPVNTRLRTDLGDVLALLKRHAEAIQQYEMSLRLNPQQPGARLRCGVAHLALGQPAQALLCFNEAVKQSPRDAEAHFRRATAMGRLGQVNEAVQALQRAIKLAPDDARFHNQLGTMWLARGDVQAAQASFERALTLSPRLAMALCNRGITQLTATRYRDAQASFEAALREDPSLHAAHVNLGLALMWQGQPDVAQAAMQRGIELQPEDPFAKWNLAGLKLAMGDWRAGWPLFESRWASVLKGQLPDFTAPQWDGRQSIDGKTVLVHHEQGLGDSVQFCRYVPMLCERGARVVVHAPAELVRLMHSLPGAITVVPRDQPVPRFDFHVPMMSLPGAFRTVPDDVPAASRYLSAQPADVARWAERLGPRQGGPLRVGLVWSGGYRPDQLDLSAVNQRRNIPLRLLAPLARPGVAFYSLQKGKEAEAEWAALRDKGWAGPQLIDLSSELRDFADTAALISQLDLVISVDTSTAHVAAAMGKPVWLLNRFDTCWRWMYERSDSPWYDSVTQFRQREPGQWAPVVAAVSEALEGLLTSSQDQVQVQVQTQTPLGDVAKGVALADLPA
jgi:tetratricopeptide (TPR) repeat protein